MESLQLHFQSSDSEADHSLAYRLGSSVLNSLPIYGRFRRTETEEKFAPSISGTRTPPPGYYDLSALEREREPEGSSTAAELNPGNGNAKKRSPPLACESTMTEDLPAEGPNSATKRFLSSFGTLLKTLGSESPAAEIVSSWLPEESSLVAHTTTTVASSHGECNCFQCFQQHQLYLLWLQSQGQGQNYPVMHQQHTQQQILSVSCQRPTLPPRPGKPLLHRFTATLILQIFTFAFVVYPHVKSLFLTGYAWERRNHVSERVLTAVLGISGWVWLWVMWLLDGTAASTEWRGEVGEQRVRKWVVKTGGEVVGGVVDGLQMGMSVWGIGGKGKGRMVVVG